MPLVPEGVLLSQKDDGAKVTLRHGELLAVGLEFASGTAFTWKVKDDCKKHLTLKQHVIFRPASAPPGSPRYSVYAYQAARIGKCDLSYQLAAPPGVLGKHVTYHLTILPKVARE